LWYLVLHVGLVGAVRVCDRGDGRALAAAQIEHVLVAAVLRKPVDRVLEVNLERTASSRDFKKHARKKSRTARARRFTYFERTQAYSPTALLRCSACATAERGIVRVSRPIIKTP
jgi:hypothetical protein